MIQKNVLCTRSRRSHENEAGPPRKSPSRARAAVRLPRVPAGPVRGAVWRGRGGRTGRAAEAAGASVWGNPTRCTFRGWAVGPIVNLASARCERMPRVNA